MSLSVYYDDEDIISILRSFFDPNEQWTIDFESYMRDIINYDEDYYSLTIKNRTFLIHKITGTVEEVES